MIIFTPDTRDPRCIISDITLPRFVYVVAISRQKEAEVGICPTLQMTKYQLLTRETYTGHLRRQGTNVKPTLIQRFVSAG